MVFLPGMAGLAEAGEAFALMIGYGGLLLLVLTAALGFFVRSRVAAGTALTVGLVLTLIFVPWEAFRPFESDDPDVHHWVAAWRGFARCWGIAAAASIAATIRAFCFPGEESRSKGEQPAE